jgi:L-asparaginase II
MSSSTGVPGLDSVVQLAEVVRNGFLESRHFGLAVALDPDGSPLYAAGAVDAEVLPRSTAKPLQAVGAVVAGADLDAEQTAIAAGSHTGEDLHVDLVERTLREAGLSPDALGCPSDWPEDEPTRHRLIATGGRPERIRMNCSGKHAAMLAATVATGNDPARYLDPDSPVQQIVRAETERLTGSTVDITAIDGCGTPLFAVPLSGLARAFGRLATAAPGTPDRRVADAMRNHPHLVGGTGHPNSDVMRLLPGVLAKGGAEGVLAMAAPDGHAVAVKVIDGSPRATTAIALTLLRKCGVDISPAADLLDLPVLGGGRPVGTITPTL